MESTYCLFPFFVTKFVYSYLKIDIYLKFDEKSFSTIQHSNKE